MDVHTLLLCRRHSISLVCRRLYEEEARTRKHVTVALCYSTTPQQLLRRLPFVESLKLKGKPRAAVFNLIPEDWGGFVTPWVEELSKSFRFLKALHFRRMIVKDEDLELLAREKGDVLQALKLDKCSGFSTDGLLHISRSCRNLKVLFLEESQVIEKDGNWLHELTINNTQLETLNFYMTDLSQVSFSDLELIAERCKSLVSVKIGDRPIAKSWILLVFSGLRFFLKNSVAVALTTNPRSMQI
ncbi:putative leucine-rich repeat domain superfamily, transport inhibitor response 1 [Helianthus annuus]|nr:putative leucine-rich repeat domain superfamily, transport inhibitor response 1 [Helianthus annuus]